jgi:peptidoglycan/xylan/chitin deacetylase (PgdA/CDA1 family)
MNPELYIVMYHYVRDLPNTPFPRIKGMLTKDFQRQLSALKSRYEMATLESALAFVRGYYVPRRDLCLLTFDDGLKEHYAEVMPLLVEARVQGLFFVITGCVQDQRVAPVHMNHFLMATLDFDVYRSAFLQRLQELAPDAATVTAIDPTVAQRSYRWDSPEIAAFKYFFNFVVDAQARDHVLHSLFEEEFGAEVSFSQTLYFNWEEAKQMQAAGMLIGGHSHHHRPLATLSAEELHWDLRTCQRLLSENVQQQTLWSFCYPYGKRDSFNAAAISQLEQLEYACAFSSELGTNLPGVNAFALHRLDCKDAPTT